jgi:hypothetical protein
MVQAASGNIGLILLVSPRGSTALTLVGSRRTEARCRWLLQGTLLREVPWLTISIAATSLAVVIGVEGVTVTSSEVSACRTVAWVLAVRVIGPGGL